MIFPVFILTLVVSLVNCEDYYGYHRGFDRGFASMNRANPQNSQSYAYLAKWYPHLKRFVGRGGSNNMYNDQSLGIDYMPANEQDVDGPSMYNDDYRGDSMYGRYGTDSSEYLGPRDQEPGYGSHYDSKEYDESNPQHLHHVQNPYGYSVNHKKSYQTSPQFSFGHSLNHEDKKHSFDDYGYGSNKFDYDD